MNLSGLLPLLQHLAPFTELTELLARNEAPAEPQAIYHAARAYVTAGLRQQRPAPLLLITARSEMAQQLYEQLALWLPPVEDGGPPRYLFADPDALPYERITWSNDTRQRRLTALAALQARGGTPPLVITSARALMQKTLPARELRLALRSIKVGSPLRLEQLTVAWVQNGYHPVEIVEEPGAFARRGGLVDIWPPNLPLPVRIDLFGDEVESLRVFDPASQRTLHQVQSIEIGPGSEVLAKYGPMILQRLNIAGDNLFAEDNLEAGGHASPLADASLLLALREELRREVEQLAASHSFHGVEWYLPYAYEQPASILDYVDANATLVVDDALDLFATFGELEQQALGLQIELQRTGELPHGFASSYFAVDELRTRLVNRSPLILGYGDLYGKASSANTPLARAFAPGPRFGGKIKEIATNVAKLHSAGESIVLATRQAARLRDM
ncbi:MAG: hypothetical protein KAX65_16610, partial [Caldilineaceae bacterium]|nr:hypothetical protein [Caldilineaceae bacterium]